MSGRFGPHRRFRNELFTLALAAFVPFVLFSVFPLAALRPLPPPPGQAATALCAFVNLSPVEERHALAQARAAWQIDRRGSRRVRIDLFADSLPDHAPQAVLAVPPASGDGGQAPAPYAADLLPPTLAAPPPVPIAPQADTDTPAFSREELLKID